jgi:hypothetical protein
VYEALSYYISRSLWALLHLLLTLTLNKQKHPDIPISALYITYRHMHYYVYDTIKLRLARSGGVHARQLIKGFSPTRTHPSTRRHRHTDTDSPPCTHTHAHTPCHCRGPAWGPAGALPSALQLLVWLALLVWHALLASVTGMACFTHVCALYSSSVSASVTAMTCFTCALTHFSSSMLYLCDTLYLLQLLVWLALLVPKCVDSF